MSTRNVVLTDHQAQLVDRLVKSGRYQNASEVLRDGLRLVETRASEDQARLQALRVAARVGTADFDAGQFTSFTDADQLDRHFSRIAAAAVDRGAARKVVR